MIRAGSSAAFSVEEEGWEQIAVAIEVERQYRETDADDVIVAVRQTIADQHEVDVAVIVLLKPGTLPRTTSGKIQRGKAREEYLANEFKPLVCWKTVTPLEALPIADESSFDENEPAPESVAAPDGRIDSSLAHRPHCDANGDPAAESGRKCAACDAGVCTSKEAVLSRISLRNGWAVPFQPRSFTIIPRSSWRSHSWREARQAPAIAR